MKNVLHIYGPQSWHDEIIIVGDIEGLMTLKKAVNRAITVYDAIEIGGYCPASSLPAEPYPFEINHKDGEGSSIYIAVATPEQIDKFPLPYTDEVAAAPNTKEQNYNLWEHCIPGYRRPA